jgi:hypothetical protein
MWALLDHLARRFPGGWLPLTLSLMYMAAALVLLHAYSARLAEVGVILSAALAGLALIAWHQQLPIDGAIPAVAITLPGLMLIGQQNTFSEVPVSAFALPALAPLALGALLALRVKRFRT